MKQHSQTLAKKFPITLVLIRLISWIIVGICTISAFLIILNTFIASIDMKHLAHLINVIIIGTIIAPLSMLVTLTIDFIRSKQLLLALICVAIIPLIALLFIIISKFKI